MLRSLEIVNYALIDHLFVELCPQLNVITGETGAGKSILVDALSMVLGGRASVDFIRTGEDRFSVEAEFFLGKSHLRNSEIDDFSEGTGVLNLRRELSSSGRSRCYANGNPLSVKALREIGKLLVDLHGQHDHQSILDVQKHLDYLDDYGNLGKGREKVERIYRKLTDLNKRREKASWESEQLLARRDLLEHQIEEIRFAELQPGEDEALALKLERLSHSERLREIVFQLKEILYEKNDSVAEALGVGIKLAEEGAGNDNTLKEKAEALSEMFYTSEEIVRGIDRYAGGLETDPGELDRVSERLNLINALKKKYGGDIKSVLTFCEKAERELNQLQDFKQMQDNICREIEELSIDFSKACEALSKRRKETALKLSEEIKASLVDLGMPNVIFETGLKRREDPNGMVNFGGKVYAATSKGLETGEFFISTNPGEKLRPLVKVASGGEISRIMLALKSIFPQSDSVQVLIFDEIDMGISGRVAEAVGKRLKALSKRYQTISITHLPQIAGKADLHMSARKNVVAGRTVTLVEILNDEERVKEVAAMMGGETVSEMTLRHAREIIK